MSSDEVDEWFESYDNPMKEVVQRAREVILAADDRVEECIKWKSPTFTFNGNIASFNPRSKKHASLMFHTGKQIPGDHPPLEGDGDTAGYMRFSSIEDVDVQSDALRAVVANWCAWKE